MADQLQRLATFNPHQLAGQFANLDFWLAEAGRAIEIIDDYAGRFVRMRDAQLAWVDAHDTVVSDWCAPCGGACEFGPQRPDPPTRISSSELNLARKAVRDGAYRLLVRLYRAEWIDETRLRAACEQVGTGFDLGDLERRGRRREAE